MRKSRKESQLHTLRPSALSLSLFGWSGTIVDALVLPNNWDTDANHNPVLGPNQIYRSMDLNDPAEYEYLSALIKGFSNDTRLALLLGFHASYTASDIAEFLDITRGGLQNNINKMAEANLIYRPSAADAPTYRLTPIGELFAQFFDTYGDTVLTALNELHQTREQIAQEITDSPVAGSLSERDTEKLIHTKSWEDRQDEITARLMAASDEVSGPDPTQPNAAQTRGFAFTSSLSAEEIADLLDEVTDQTETQ